VPDHRAHRGAHPEDERLFSPVAWPRLKEAVADLSFLLTRGYNDVSALKLCGDRYALTERQRRAVGRAACADQALARRRAHQLAPAAIAGQPLSIDGFNVLTTVEAALGGAVLLACRDGTYRDMASVHGSYRKVEESAPALLRIGQVLGALQAGPATWYLDSPVSNSGRLKALIYEVAAEQGWGWRVEVVQSPDEVLARGADIAVTADSGILDRCARWFNLARLVVERAVPTARVVPLGDER
jgi:hypothetical protein